MAKKMGDGDKPKGKGGKKGGKAPKAKKGY